MISRRNCFLQRKRFRRQLHILPQRGWFAEPDLAGGRPEAPGGRPGPSGIFGISERDWPSNYRVLKIEGFRGRPPVGGRPGDRGPPPPPKSGPGGLSPSVLSATSCNEISLICIYVYCRRMSSGVCARQRLHAVWSVCILKQRVSFSQRFYARKQNASRVFAIVWASAVCPSVRLSHS